MQRLNAHLHAQKKPPYILNLDPAVRNVPFESNIDIRDSVNYKEVMKQYVSSTLWNFCSHGSVSAKGARVRRD